MLRFYQNLFIVAALGSAIIFPALSLANTEFGRQDRDQQEVLAQLRWEASR